MAGVVIDGVTKRWPDGSLANDDIHLEIVDGEFMVLLGPSGCGKSTLLRLIAGLEEPTTGRILVDGRDVSGEDPRARDVAMVFQNYALYPHMTVRRNLAFPLRMARVKKAQIEERVTRVAESLGLLEVLGKKPGALSGGQMQRVALGRALVRNPRIFLFDEPLSNVDAKLRAEMRAELKDLHVRLGVTMVYVTHDQVEAMTLGDRMAVMEGGRVRQVGQPLDVWRRPANVFVARFLGSPPMNVLLGAAADRLRPEGAPPDCLVGFRPEAATPGTLLGGATRLVETLGETALVHLLVDGENVVISRAVGDRGAIGASCTFQVPRTALHLFDRRTGDRLDG
jgi:multiple sugar transport system ATP-binding protein